MPRKSYVVLCSGRTRVLTISSFQLTPGHVCRASKPRLGSNMKKGHVFEGQKSKNRRLTWFEHNQGLKVVSIYLHDPVPQKSRHNNAVNELYGKFDLLSGFHAIDTWHSLTLTQRYPTQCFILSRGSARLRRSPRSDKSGRDSRGPNDASSAGEAGSCRPNT